MFVFFVLWSLSLQASFFLVLILIFHVVSFIIPDSNFLGALLPLSSSSLQIHTKHISKSTVSTAWICSHSFKCCSLCIPHALSTINNFKQNITDVNIWTSVWIPPTHALKMLQTKIRFNLYKSSKQDSNLMCRHVRGL